MEVMIYLIVIAVIIYLILNRKKKSISNNITSYKVENTSSSVNLSNSDSESDKNVNDSSQSDYLDNYWIPVESKRREVKLNLQIKYKNTSSIISNRQFDLTSFSRGEKGYHLHGYCHNKNRNITLSSLGILEVADISSGEIIPDIIEYIERTYKDTVYYKQDYLFDEYGWAIYILVYLSATSGSVVKKERDIIISFIKSIKPYEELSEEWLDKTIKELYRPGKMEIRNWIKEGISKNYDYQLLFPWIAKLESLQQESNKEFYNLKIYIEKQLKDSNDIAKA